MLKDLIIHMRARMNKYNRYIDYRLDEIHLEGEMLIVNQKKEEIFLEIRFSKKQMFGKECYSFICENRNQKVYIDKLKEFKQVMDVLQEGIIIIDKESDIIYRNNTISNIFGLPIDNTNEEKSSSLGLVDNQSDENNPSYKTSECNLEICDILIVKCERSFT